MISSIQSIILKKYKPSQFFQHKVLQAYGSPLWDENPDFEVQEVPNMQTEISS